MGDDEKAEDKSHLEKIRTLLFTATLHAVKDYLVKVCDPFFRKDSDGLLWCDMHICTIIRGFSNLSAHQFSKHIPDFYDSFVKMIHFGSQVVRVTLTELFSGRMKCI